MITHSQRAKRGFRIFALVRCHGSMSSIDFNRKVLFYMYKQYSNTFGSVKYIYNEDIQKRKVLRFFSGSVYKSCAPTAHARVHYLINTWSIVPVTT